MQPDIAFDPDFRVVRLPRADWLAYAAGLRTRGGRRAFHLRQRVERAAAAAGTADGAPLRLTAAERAILRELDEQAAAALPSRGGRAAAGSGRRPASAR